MKMTHEEIRAAMKKEEEKKAEAWEKELYEETIYGDHSSIVEDLRGEWWKEPRSEKIYNLDEDIEDLPF